MAAYITYEINVSELVLGLSVAAYITYEINVSELVLGLSVAAYITYEINVSELVLGLSVAAYITYEINVSEHVLGLSVYLFIERAHISYSTFVHYHEHLRRVNTIFVIQERNIKSSFKREEGISSFCNLFTIAPVSSVSCNYIVYMLSSADVQNLPVSCTYYK